MDQDRQNSQNHDTEHAGRDREFATYRIAQSSNDMVPTVFRRGIYRTIRGSLKRFLSIVVITALGVSVMCGLKAGCEDLCDSVDAYFDQQNVYDINVQSTYGLTRDDLAAIQEVDGVETAEGIYTETAYTAVGTTRERVVVQSLSKENIDQPVLVNGDLPESADEVAVTSKFLKASGKKLGDTVSFAANDASSSNQSAKDQFAAGDYTITAEVLDPTDVSSDSTVNAFRAASAADYKFYVSEDAATSSSYSAIRVIVEGAKSLNSYSDAYAAKINEVKGNIEKIREEREKARAQELTVDTPTSLDAAERQANMLFGIEQGNIDRMAEGSDERVQAQAELDQRRAAANQHFADARAELSDLGECTWYIQDRGNIASYSSVESDSSSIEAIATVFPFIFFIVAVLISLTTATRMVEEERTLIGLYKALGYSRERILSKYVDYSLWACLIGGVLGNIIGFVGLPLFLFTVFDDMYSLPQMLLSYDIVSSIVSVALFAVGVVGATIIACRHEMAETPASLMRPKAPRAGSRILLERIGFIWRRMGFLNKVAARNLFRYKKRAFMTIFGIAGCTALVICGMGIRDTSVALSPKQYGHITRYDLLAVANPDDFSQTCAALDERSAANDSNVTVTSTLPIMTDNVTFTFGGKSETVQLIVVPDDRTDDLGDYVRLEDESKEPLSLRDGDVYLSKSSQLVLGIQPGDTAHVQDSSLNVAKVKVSDISLNYLGNTLYMTQGTYERAFGRSARLNGIFVLLKGSPADQIAFSKNLKSDGWLTISSTAEHWENYEANFTIINSVVVLVTFMAACLSFVVVFTLSNTNISERERELATIKVLGFRRGEVHHYVNKETLILTAIGAALGVPLGGALAESFTYILQMPSLYFDVEVEPMSYVLAVVLSFGFTFIVNLATNRTLNKIDMVGALKSAE